MEEPCNKPTDCGPGADGCPKICIEGTTNLDASLPSDFVPYSTTANGFHRIVQQPQCNDENCGQRIQVITMQGHEISMMDTPSGASRIQLTTSDATKHINLDEANKIMWFTSGNHKMIFADDGHDTAVGSSTDVKYVDPNQMVGSTYQLIQTEKQQKIWLADSADCPRIHAHTTKGHEVLLLDKSVDAPKGKIQVTTYDKTMQFIMDLDSGNIHINNMNTSGAGGETTNAAPGSIRMYAVGEIELHAELGVGIFSNKDIMMGAPSGGIIGTDNSTTLMKLPSGPGVAPVPGAIKPSVLTEVIAKGA